MGMSVLVIINTLLMRLQTGSIRSSSMSDPSSSRNAAWEPITNKVAPDKPNSITELISDSFPATGSV